MTAVTAPLVCLRIVLHFLAPRGNGFLYIAAPLNNWNLYFIVIKLENV